MAKRRRRRSSKSRGEWGYYIFQDFGLSVVYAAQENDDGSVDTAFFAVDVWRDGLIACKGKVFDTKESFDEEMAKRNELIKPSVRFYCQTEIAYGLRIRQAAKAKIPVEFDQWRHLVEPLDEVKLPDYLYRCPKCGRGLPDYHIEQIIDGVDGNTFFYLLCELCQKSRKIRRSSIYNAVMQGYLLNAIEETEEFSVTWYDDNLPELMNIPINPSYNEALEEMIEDDEYLEAASLSIEAHIAYAALPNRIVEDQHILNATQAVIKGELVEDEIDDLEIVDFLIEAIKEGINLFMVIMDSRVQATAQVRLTLRRIEDSIMNHHSNSNPRSYIQFISRFITL
jgi:hypothetical protein